MQKSALFVFGGWEGHEPRACVEAVAPVVEAAGLSVKTSDSLSAFDDAGALSRFSVIVPAWTMGTLTRQQEQALTAAVRGGAGLAGWHGGMGDAFRQSADYQFMVGGQFVAHPGNIRDYKVHIADRGHPITKGVDDFTIRSEQYYMHVDPSNTVLATTTFSGDPCPWIAGCRMPVVWTRGFGGGRVFYCSAGHCAADLRVPAVMEIIRRGILWAARALE